MIIQCPACSTKYVVPDTAIGVEGRTVRCAKCKHSWFQDGPVLDTKGQEKDATGHVSGSVAQPDPEPFENPAHSRAEAAAPANTRNAETSPIAKQEGGKRDQVPPLPPVDRVDFDDDAPSHFDAEPPFRPRRNPLKIWTWAAGIFALVAAALIFAVSYWGLPDWVPVDRPEFAAGNPDLQLDFPQEQQVRRTLPNNTEFFGASGTITNIGTEAVTVPSILIVLRDARDRKVYEWVVPPPQRTIAPGETVPVNEAVTDIPRSARNVFIGWKPD